jgi:hypothetical protein
MCPVPNGFRDGAISLYSSKIVDEKEILRTVSNIGIYCSSDKVGTVYLVVYIFKNSTVNINALCNSCEEMACCSSVQCTVYHRVFWGREDPQPADHQLYNLCLNDAFQNITVNIWA